MSDGRIKIDVDLSDFALATVLVHAYCGAHKMGLWDMLSDDDANRLGAASLRIEAWLASREHPRNAEATEAFLTAFDALTDAVCADSE